MSDAETEVTTLTTRSEAETEAVGERLAATLSRSDVVYLVARDPRRLTRLSSLGLTAGARLHVLQTAPATVVRVGHTTIAFESVLAGEMYVRRVPAR